MTRGRRRSALLAALVTVALGLATRRIHLGVPVWDKSAGDVLYAVMVGFLLVAVHPRMRHLGPVTFGVCAAIEAFQATGLPARAPRLVRLALGTTFAWHDLACYAVGALVVVALARRLS